MSDNITVTPGTGATIAADDIGTGSPAVPVLAQRVKPVWGPDGTGNDVDTASGKALPVQLRSPTGIDVSATLINFGAGEYETVAASVSSPQSLGATGAAGDYLQGILVVPGTTSPGTVTLYDGSTSPDVGIVLFTGGASSVSNLVPFFIPIGLISTIGAWKVTTGSNVTCLASGNFT